MTSTIEASAVLTALDQRLLTAATVLAPQAVPAPLPTAVGEVSAALLPTLIAACRGADKHDARWLVWTAVTGTFPTPNSHRRFSRRLELVPDHVAETWLLECALAPAHRRSARLPMSLVAHGVVADVDFCARHDTHTGIQRVVRGVMPRWASAHDITATAWVDDYTAMRSLAPHEHTRVFQHQESLANAVDDLTPRAEGQLVVPWKSVVVLPDVPNPGSSDALSALAQFSGNTLSLIGYDMIPVTSGETRPPADSVTFAQYLTVVKHAHRVAGISRSATTEFAGYASALSAQGMVGPHVTEVPLTEEAPSPEAGDRTPHQRERPLVVCIGTHEPHKNHRTILHAAERLWRQGLDFELRLIGKGGWTDAAIAPGIARLTAADRPLDIVRDASDDELWASLRAAAFTVFISLHEGYGLPVAESLSCGTPVITSNFGSQQEIAQNGGCLTVDPRDDDAVTDAMRLLLTDATLRDRLRAEALARPQRTWDQYAEELWEALVAPPDSASTDARTVRDSIS
ncbi:glycosyltransferase family 4 protein [Cellulomonas chengniuliangii]|uniref:Glycosyltransferase family 4 protein n=1 Tax=Cellulomonas chengniuliangii TaxID=2968084 RepID=A0ABY5KXQ7_9CELL|nr:glycosyltransferase family 1 protein [Cellulomonas chengniuliangii]MCC2308728.1 glycosyltransferase family 4 protein [Cellulomonas chengniuliangii]UUI74520.1 glycosyltransferase family 4 protein [Cellulomonas chengniuliangii]